MSTGALPHTPQPHTHTPRACQLCGLPVLYRYTGTPPTWWGLRSVLGWLLPELADKFRMLDASTSNDYQGFCSLDKAALLVGRAVSASSPTRVTRCRSARISRTRTRDALITCTTPLIHPSRARASRIAYHRVSRFDCRLLLARRSASRSGAPYAHGRCRWCNSHVS